MDVKGREAKAKREPRRQERACIGSVRAKREGNEEATRSEVDDVQEHGCGARQSRRTTSRQVINQGHGGVGQIGRSRNAKDEMNRPREIDHGEHFKNTERHDR